MPSAIHEALVLLFQNNPGFTATLLRDVLGIELPEYAEAQAATSSFSDMTPPEFRADAVTNLVDADGRPVFAAIAEVQLSIVEKKKADWHAYTATTIRQQRCEAAVLVVTPHAHVARWARSPLKFGVCSTFTPLVIGPEELPLIEDPDEAKNAPYLAILSAVAHGEDEVEKAVKAASAARDALASVNLPDGDVYFDLIKASLSEPARKAFEMLAETYEYQDESLRKSFHRGRDEGRSEGEANAVLVFLEARGVSVSEQERARITGCNEPEQLERMIGRAASVQTASELFD